MGYLGWKDFNEFISFANISCDWIVLRNFEFLLQIFQKMIKILISYRDKKHFIQKSNRQRSRISAYQANIGKKLIPVDLRFIGDGYYDKLWENNMLENKIFQKNLVPRPCNLDYFYSLIYHSKLQKESVKKIYSARLDNLKLILGINNLKNSFIYNDLITSKLLSDFMNFNKYKIGKPLDNNLEFNNDFHKKLSQLQEINTISNPPLSIKLMLILPKPLRELLVKTKKNLSSFLKRWLT